MEGKKHGALAITEPETGSDVANICTFAEDKGDHFVINGSKNFITNGYTSDYIITACKTNKDAGAAGISLIVVDRNSEGLSAQKLDKLGWHASDTAIIFYDNVKVPKEQLIGKQNQGFYYIMEQFALERLVLAISATAASESALEYTLKYMSERSAFGKTINRFQVLRHRIADLATEIEISKRFNYYVSDLYSKGEYRVKECAMAKLKATELSDRVVYECLQCFGGYGYMEEYKISRMFRDSRLGTIGGGTSEIMKEIISKAVIDQFDFAGAASLLKRQTT
ncbi:UNVERIFIED_CONTAM: hypothetical protein GTU68_066572 [Idotea baltica]|nr:hypothetical protein [Idotea baltica]